MLWWNHTKDFSCIGEACLSFYLVMKCEVGGLRLRHACVRFNVNQLYCRGKCDFWQAKMWFTGCLFFYLTCHLGLDWYSFFEGLLLMFLVWHFSVSVTENPLYSYITDAFLIVALASLQAGLTLPHQLYFCPSLTRVIMYYDKNICTSWSAMITTW